MKPCYHCVVCRAVLTDRNGYSKSEVLLCEVCELERKNRTCPPCVNSKICNLQDYCSVHGPKLLSTEDKEIIRISKVLLEREQIHLELEHVKERVKWVLDACEIDRDARNELESLLER